MKTSLLCCALLSVSCATPTLQQKAEMDRRQAFHKCMYEMSHPRPGYEIRWYEIPGPCRRYL